MDATCSASGLRPLHFAMKYQPCGRRNQGRPFKRLLDF